MRRPGSGPRPTEAEATLIGCPRAAYRFREGAPACPEFPVAGRCGSADVAFQAHAANYRRSRRASARALRHSARLPSASNLRARASAASAAVSRCSALGGACSVGRLVDPVVSGGIAASTWASCSAHGPALTGTIGKTADPHATRTTVCRRRTAVLPLLQQQDQTEMPPGRFRPVDSQDRPRVSTCSSCRTYCAAQASRPPVFSGPGTAGGRSPGRSSRRTRGVVAGRRDGSGSASMRMGSRRTARHPARLPR